MNVSNDNRNLSQIAPGANYQHQSASPLSSNNISLQSQQYGAWQPQYPLGTQITENMNQRNNVYYANNSNNANTVSTPTSNMNTADFYGHDDGQQSLAYGA